MISKEELFSSLEELQSTPVLEPSQAASTDASVHSVVVTDPEGQDRDRHKSKGSHLRSLMGMLSEQGMCNSTDDELPCSKSVRCKRESTTPTHPLNLVLNKSYICAEDLNDGSQTVERLTEKSPVNSSLAAVPLSLTISNASSLEHTNTTHPSTLTEKEMRPTSRQSLHGPTNLSKLETIKSKDFYPYSSDHQFGRANSDSDDSDFEIFVPPKKKLVHSSKDSSQKKSTNEQVSTSHVCLEKDNIRISSPALTKRPTWFKKSATSLCSLLPDAAEGHICMDDQESNQKTSEVLEVLSNSPTTLEPNPSVALDEQNRDNGGDSSGDIAGGTSVELKQNLIRTKVEDDDAALTRAEVFHRYNTVYDEDNDDDDSVGCCTYLDPKDLMEYSEPIKRKERGTISVTDVDQTYLTLIDIDASVEFTEKPKERALISEEYTIPLQDEGSFLSVNNSTERWRRSRDLTEGSCCSGYSTDTSSVWGDCDSEKGGVRKSEKVEVQREGGERETEWSKAVYDDVDTLQQGGNSNPATRGQAGQHDDRDSEIYEAIDDLYLDHVRDKEKLETDFGSISSPPMLRLSKSHSQLNISSSVPFHTDTAKFYSPSHRRASRTLPISRSRESLYASLDSTTITSSRQKLLQNPPSLPPRPLGRLSSLDPRQFDRGQVAKEKSNIPGVSELLSMVCSCMARRSVNMQHNHDTINHVTVCYVMLCYVSAFRLALCLSSQRWRT